MRRAPLLLVLLFLTACPPAPTLNAGDAAETQLYLAPNGDVIVESPRPIENAEVRVAADVVMSPRLVSPGKSAYGFFRLLFPDEEANYGRCIRIPAENATAGWVGLTMTGDEFSEARVLDMRRRKPPQGCR